FEEVCRDVLRRTFAIDSDQPDTTIVQLHVVDDAKPTALALAGQMPSQLAAPTRARYQVARFRPLRQRGLQRAITFVVEIVVDHSLEDRRLNVLVHVQTPFRARQLYGIAV